jgi:O-antigen/teichoic acid export membrane protein
MFAPVLAAVATFAIPLVFGPRFQGSIVLLLWLLPGLVAMAVGSPLVLYLVQQRGRPVLSGAAALIGLAVDVLLCFIWIPGHGALGAAWASSVAYSAQALLLLLWFRAGTGTAWRDLLIPRRGDWIATRNLIVQSLESLIPRLP